MPRAGNYERVVINLHSSELPDCCPWCITPGPRACSSREHASKTYCLTAKIGCCSFPPHRVDDCSCPQRDAAQADRPWMLKREQDGDSARSCSGSAWWCNRQHMSKTGTAQAPRQHSARVLVQLGLDTCGTAACATPPLTDEITRYYFFFETRPQRQPAQPLRWRLRWHARTFFENTATTPASREPLQHQCNFSGENMTTAA
jgi:hypothetical protein